VIFGKIKFTPGDSLYFDISGLLRAKTKGGFVVVKSDKLKDTVNVSVAGIAYIQQ
jgi:hypothetical protein